MLKRMFIKKIILIIAILFTIGLLYLLPNDSKLNLKEEVEYIDNSILTSVAYLLDENDYLVRTKVVVSSNEVLTKSKELVEALILGRDDKIPNGFKGVIPEGTKINSISFNNGLIKIDFSKELLDLKINKEEKMIEAIVYTLTSIKEVENIIIYVEGEILTKLPKSNINLPSTLDRSFGINKEYDIDNYKDVNKVTIYYLNKNHYYVPVTKYVNDDREKIKIIIDELASSYIYNSNLMSYLNSNTKLLATEQELDSLFLVFNDYIFSDMTTNNILEEVIYSISLSIKDNYDVKEVVFEVGDKEIYKTTMKTLENY